MAVGFVVRSVSRRSRICSWKFLFPAHRPNFRVVSAFRLVVRSVAVAAEHFPTQTTCLVIASLLVGSDPQLSRQFLCTFIVPLC